MNSKQLAQTLNGREYGDVITETEATQAKKAGLGVVYGYSDDCMEFDGVVYGEVYCDDGGFAYIDVSTREAVAIEPIVNSDGSSDSAFAVQAIWDTEGFSWTYKTDIPHETFIIMDEGEKYCRGIVFALADVGKVTR